MNVGPNVLRQDNRAGCALKKPALRTFGQMPLQLSLLPYASVDVFLGLESTYVEEDGCARKAAGNRHPGHIRGRVSVRRDIGATDGGRARIQWRRQTLSPAGSATYDNAALPSRSALPKALGHCAKCGLVRYSIFPLKADNVNGPVRPQPFEVWKDLTRPEWI